MELKCNVPLGIPTKVGTVDFPDYEAKMARMSPPPIIANDIDTSTKDGQDRLNALLYTRYQGDLMSAVPKCACGELTGGYNKGLICDICETECQDVLDKPLESTVWVRVPNGIKKFICPGAWIVLSRALTRSGFNMLEWLVNPLYPDPLPKNALFPIVEGLNIQRHERNLNFFYDNFERIMRNYVKLSLLRKQPRNIPNMTQSDIQALFQEMHAGETEATDVLINTSLGEKYIDERKFAKFVEKYCLPHQKTKIFSAYLPLPSAQGLVLESNGGNTWVDPAIPTAINALYSITQMEMSALPAKAALKNRRTVTCTKRMAEFSKSYITGTAGTKHGEFRRHVMGGRLPFSMRAVITSINRPHRHDEIELPWAPSVQMFKQHILNKLLRRGYSPKQATMFIEDHTNHYHPLLGSIFDELLAESGNGIKCTLQRNPSLEKASMQRVRITHIKRDPRILTISMSVNITNGPNADFDGDALHVLLILDKQMDERFHRLKPSRSVLNLDEPRKLSGVFKQQAPQTLTMYNYLYGDRDRQIATQATN